MITLDCRGQVCPDPLNTLRSTLRTLKSGDKVQLLSDDIASLREIPSFCHFIGHKLISTPSNGDCSYVVVKK